MQKNNKKLAYSDWDSSDLRSKREEIGKTQSKMAEILGISARMYRYYENGRTPISKPMEYAMRYLSQISQQTRKEMEDLSQFEYDRVVRLRNAVEKALDEPIDNSQDDYIRRILNQTLKEFDMVLSKTKR
jgi:transcriptional regulator with XRE-family HTH domain